jgi:hypothetical protein
MVSDVWFIVRRYCNLASKHRLLPADTAWFFNIYLMPKLEQAFRVLPLSDNLWSDHLMRWNRMIISCISKLAGEKDKMWKDAAVAELFELRLPSEQLAIIQTSECFIRLNAETGVDSSLARQQFGDGGSRVAKMVRMAQTELGWMMKKVPVSRRGGWTAHPMVPLSSITKHFIFDDVRTPLVFGYRGSWGSRTTTGRTTKEQPLMVCTDGSYLGDASSWAFCVVNDWLIDNVTALPLEADLTGDHLVNACAHGHSIDPKVTSTIYTAELQAVFRALMAFPASLHLLLVIDSQSVVTSIEKYLQETSSRKKMRMSGRPLLELISKAIKSREQAGGSTQVKWQRAHTDDVSVESVGNRVADFVANNCREQQERSHFSVRDLPELDVKMGEKWVCCRRKDDGSMIVNDLRREGQEVMRRKRREKWSESTSQKRYESDGVIQLMKMVREKGWNQENRDKTEILRQKQNLALRLATDTVQKELIKDEDKKEKSDWAIEKKCRCGELLTAHHLMLCEEWKDEESEREMRNKMLSCLRSASASAWLLDWMKRKGAHQSWQVLMMDMFSSYDKEATSNFLSRCLFGGFSAQECGRALKAMKVNKDERKEICDVLREMLFTECWRRWKKMLMNYY